jgi:hypothetical protein
MRGGEGKVRIRIWEGKGEICAESEVDGEGKPLKGKEM